VASSRSKSSVLRITSSQLRLVRLPKPILSRRKQEIRLPKKALLSKAKVVLAEESKDRTQLRRDRKVRRSPGMKEDRGAVGRERRVEISHLMKQLSPLPLSDI
jgi:hypothetical protein